MTQPAERYELIISIEPAQTGYDITTSLIYTNWHETTHEDYPSMQAAIAAITEQYTNEYGFNFSQPFTEQPNGTYRADLWQ